MKRRIALHDDPVVAEVPAAREALSREAGGSIAAFVELVRKRASEFRRANRSPRVRRRRA